MGAKTGLLVYSDGGAAQALRRVSSPDAAGTMALIERLYPGWAVEKVGGTSLGGGTYPPYGTTYAASYDGAEIVCDRRVMLDHPSELPEHLVEESAGRRLVLHAMHSVTDWLAFAVWEDRRLVRALSLSPDDGIMEDIGDPFPFETAYWAGAHPVEPDPAWTAEPYPLPFHPLELGEDALRGLLGFVLEGMPEPEDIEPDGLGVLGFRLTDPADPDEVARHRDAIAEAVRAMAPPRRFRLGPDGALIEIDGP